MRTTRPDEFVDPPWDAPLDVAACLDAIPSDATMSGMFLAALTHAASRAGKTLSSARASYTPFRKYPLREHCVLLVETARALWPERPIRQSLRSLGRGAPATLAGSMLGRVVFSSAEGPRDRIRAMARSYPLHMSPATLDIVDDAPGRMVLALRGVHHFLDSHNVGVFEGVLRHAGAEGGVVRIRSLSRCDADLACSWRESP